MSDGAFLGIKPTDALKTILGGQPVTSERLSTQQLRYAIEGAPDDMPPRNEFQSDEGYDLTCLIVAKQVLRYLEAHPEHRELGDGKYEYPNPNTTVGRIVVEPSLYDTIKENDPHAKQVFEESGMTGFMWGWSLNAARRCLDLFPVANPAIWELKAAPEDAE